MIALQKKLELRNKCSNRYLLELYVLYISICFFLLIENGLLENGFVHRRKNRWKFEPFWELNFSSVDSFFNTITIFFSFSTYRIQNHYVFKTMVLENQRYLYVWTVNADGKKVHQHWTNPTEGSKINDKNVNYTVKW